MPFFQPSDIGGLYLWFKSTSVTGITPNTNAPSWVDDSGSGNNTNTLPFSVNFPTYQTGVINGYPSMRFAGNSYLSTITNNPSLQTAPSSCTYFSVFQTNSYTAAQAIFACDNPSNSNSAFNVGLNAIRVVNNSGWSFSYGKNANIVPNNGYFSVEASSRLDGFHVSQLNTWMIRHDRFRPVDRVFEFGLNGIGIATGIATTRSNTANTFKIGFDDTNVNDYFNGDIAEIIGYNRMLSDYEVGEVNLYLKQKYNIGNFYFFPLFLYADTPSGLYQTVPLSLKASFKSNSGISLFSNAANQSTKSTTLYTDSATQINSHFTLYTDSATVVNSSVKLYTSGKSSGNNSFTLFVWGSGEAAQPMTLYTDSATKANSGVKLFTQAASKITANCTLYTDSSTKANSGVKLYTDSSTPINSSFPMYTSGSTGGNNAHFNLYLDCSTPINSSTRLYMLGGTGHANLSCTLYTNSALVYPTIVSGISLFVAPISHSSGHMPFYIRGTNRPKITDTLTLFTYPGGKSCITVPSGFGTSNLPDYFNNDYYNNQFFEDAYWSSPSTVGGFAQICTQINSLRYGVPFYVYGRGAHASMPLVINPGKDSPKANMPLFISGPVNTGTGGNFVPLYLANSVSSTGPPGDLPLVKLYTRGAGQLDGASVFNGNMLLYIDRPASNIMTLFTNSPFNDPAEISLYTQGAFFANSLVCSQGGINVGGSGPYFGNNFFANQYFAGGYWGAGSTTSTFVGGCQGMNMFVMGNAKTSTSGNVTLSVGGDNKPGSGITLFMSQHKPTINTTLYVGGF